jgi:hypothetical protein
MYYESLTDDQQIEAVFKRDVQMSTIYQEMDRLCIWYNLNGDSLLGIMDEFEKELLEAIAEKEFAQLEIPF